MPATSKGGTISIVKTGQTRPFFQSGGPSPLNTPKYMEALKAGQLRWPQGDVTDLELPDPSNYDEFVIVDSNVGQRGKPQIPLTARMTAALSEFVRLVRAGHCTHSFQIHIGQCQDPRDFNSYSKALILEGARISEYATSELGALESKDRNPVDETPTLQGLDYYEVGNNGYESELGAGLTAEGVGIAICDRATCSGSCGSGSDGCQKIFVLGSDGLVAYSRDGGATWATSTISLGEGTANHIACIGNDAVVVSADVESLYWSNSADLANGAGSWNTVTSGFNSGNGPTKIFSLGPTLTWIVGLGGYVYFSDDIESGVAIQDAANATEEDLAAIHGYDSNNLVAVGANNAVIHTANGGGTWVAVTGPASAIDLTTVQMLSVDGWLVGTANGKLYYTPNAGVDWVQIRFPGDGSGKVWDLYFVTPSVGYLAHATTVPKGRILKTISGGNTWKAEGAMPATDRFTALGGCGDPNRIFAAGLSDSDSTGVVVKGEA